MTTTDHTTETVTVPTEGAAPTDPAEFAQWAWTQIENCRAQTPKLLAAAFKATIDADPAAYEAAYDEDVRNGELRRALRPTPMPRNDMVRSRLMLLAGILTEMVEHGDEAQIAFVKRLLGVEEPAAEEVEEVEGDLLAAAVVALETAEQNTDTLRADRDRLIREANAAGARQVDLAKIAGISQQAVALIIKTAPKPEEGQPVSAEASITTVTGETHTGPTLREVLDATWGKKAKISGAFGRLAVAVPLDGGVAKLAEVKAYEVSGADRFRAWETRNNLLGSNLTEVQQSEARTRFAEDGVLPEDAPDKTELWLIQ